MAAQRVARSAVTLQKHVRGWLTRRRMNKLLREKQEKERIERERLEKERERLEKERERLEKERQAREKKNNGKMLTFKN